MNIRKLIIFALGTCLLLILLLGGTGIYELNTSITKCVQIVDTDSRLVEYAHRVRADINIMRRFEKDTFLSVGDPAKVEEYRTKWVGVYERAKNRLEVLQKLESEPKDALHNYMSNLSGYSV
jgi:methyl-accepting chemotaxis protein